MPGSVEELKIEINSEATKANDAIDKLSKKLDVLSASITRLGGADFSNFSTGVKQLSGAMQGLSNVKLPDYTRLSKGIEKLGALDSATIARSGQAIGYLGASLQKLDSINVGDNATQITALAKGISQLGYKSATKAVNNIPKLATSMRQLMGELSKAPKVSQNLIDMTNALAKLARTGASSGKAAQSLSGALNVYSSAATKSTSKSLSLASAIGKVYASYWLAFRAFGKIGEMINIASDLTEVQNVVNVTFGDMAYKVEEFAKNSIEQFGLSELSLKQFASTFQAMGSSMNIDKASIEQANAYLNKQTNGYVGLSNSMSDVSLNLTKLTADMSSFYNVAQEDVAEDLAAIFTGQTEPMRQYGLILTENTLKEWAMTQGLNSNIEAMTGAEKTLLRYQYVLAHTGAAQGDFSRTVGKLRAA